MSQNTTLDAVLAVSRCAVAVDGETTILIERADDPRNDPMGYWYDVQRPGERVHNFSFDYDFDPFYELEDLGIDPARLEWQATEQTIDLSNCTCKACNEFLVQHGLIPRGARPLQAFGYRLLFTWQAIGWRWLTLRFWFADLCERLARALEVL